MMAESPVLAYVNLRRGIFFYPWGLNRGAEDGLLHPVGRRSILRAHVQAHVMGAGRVTEIDDRLLDHLVVRNVQGDRVIRAQAGRAPADFRHFAIVVTDLEPVADFVGSLNLQRETGDEAAEEVLGGEADNDGDRARGQEQAFQLRLGVIT